MKQCMGDKYPEIGRGRAKSIRGCSRSGDNFRMTT
jgi:hypothetical protein